MRGEDKLQLDLVADWDAVIADVGDLGLEQA
jgi:hypothetical protein